MKQIINHPFEAVYNKYSKILILGSIASEKSRELGYPYANPKNRFWKIMESLFNEKIIDYKEFLLKNKIALWDVIKTCSIHKSSDSSISDVIVNDINEIINESNIRTIFTNGKKATDLYNKYIYPKTNIKPIYLSSTSPAHATKNLEQLVDEYQIIKNFL
jgi:hypoxanthine-DNA glycosylase